MPRFTSHGEVVFESSSQGRTWHPFWGDYKQWWPGEPKPAQGNGQQGECKECPKMPPAPLIFETVEEWFDKTRQVGSDFNEHMQTLKDLASKVEVCVELSAWLKPALLSMAAGHPKKLVSVCPGVKPEWGQLSQLLQDKTEFVTIQKDSLNTEPFEHDLLFHDTRHSAAYILQDLNRWGPLCRRWIVLHTSMTFGEKGDDHGPGVLPAVETWITQHPEWVIKFHHPNNHGLICLTKDPKEYPDPPVPLRPGIPGYGPGTELKRLIASLGINPSPSCDCNAKARQMDAWGVEGCKKNRDQIVQGIRDNSPRWGWMDKVKAAALAVTKGIAFKLDITDPYGSLVDLAIRIAEEKEQGKR